MIQISIIEDHYDFRTGLFQLLEMAEGFAPISAFGNAEDAIQNLSGKENVLLLDINLPNMSGVEAISIFKNKFPNLKIIMLTMLDDDDTILQAIINGADGYLLKKMPPKQILSSIQTCMQGGSPMSGSIANKVLRLFKQFVPKQNEDFLLSKRELQILQLLVKGINNQEIADNLFISIQTVRNHIRHIYEKLQVHSKSQAVVKAIRQGLV